MIVDTDVELHKIVVHKIGSKHDNEDIMLSKSEFQIDDESLQHLLLGYFLKPFKKLEEYYSFSNDDSKVREYISQIFNAPDEFYVQSANIAKCLYDISIRPAIKTGELYVIHFKNVVVDDEMVDAIGIFKSENKDTYLKIYHQNESIKINSEHGININKIDKGCLIFNTEAEEGYKMCIVDNTSKSGEASFFWIDDFLEAKQRDTNFYKTKTILNLCRDFSDTVLIKENNIDAKDKMEFVSKSIEYFKEKDLFDVDDFNKTVIQNPTVIEAFKDFKAEYEESLDVEPVENFDISKTAVKANSKYFKSVVKLDKNFHLYIHSSPEMIEKGYDENKTMKFYKLFYESES